MASWLHTLIPTLVAPLVLEYIESLWWFHSKCTWFCWLPHQCAHRLRPRGSGLVFFPNSCKVWHTLIWSGHIQAVHRNGCYSIWDIGDIFRGSCPSRLWPMEIKSSSPSRCSISEVLQLYLTSLWIRNPNAFAGHLSQQRWQSSWKYL